MSLSEVVPRDIDGLDGVPVFINKDLAPLTPDFLPHMACKQKGGRQRFTAAMVLTSALLNVLPQPGRQTNQAELSFSLCFYAQACLSFWGL